MILSLLHAVATFFVMALARMRGIRGACSITQADDGVQVERFPNARPNLVAIVCALFLRGALALARLRPTPCDSFPRERDRRSALVASVERGMPRRFGCRGDREHPRLRSAARVPIRDRSRRPASRSDTDTAPGTARPIPGRRRDHAPGVCGSERSASTG